MWGKERASWVRVPSGASCVAACELQLRTQWLTLKFPIVGHIRDSIIIIVVVVKCDLVSVWRLSLSMEEPCGQQAGKYKYKITEPHFCNLCRMRPWCCLHLKYILYEKWLILVIHFSTVMSLCCSAYYGATIRATLHILFNLILHKHLIFFQAFSQVTNWTADSHFRREVCSRKSCQCRP